METQPSSEGLCLTGVSSTPTSALDLPSELSDFDADPGPSAQMALSTEEDFEDDEEEDGEVDMPTIPAAVMVNDRIRPRSETPSASGSQRNTNSSPLSPRKSAGGRPDRQRRRRNSPQLYDSA